MQTHRAKQEHGVWGQGTNQIYLRDKNTLRASHPPPTDNEEASFYRHTQRHDLIYVLTRLESNDDLKSIPTLLCFEEMKT